MITGILRGLKFSILGFFWLGKLSKYFSFLVPWFIQFFGGRGGVVGYIQNSLKISVAVLLVVMVSVTLNLEILTRRT